jgi:3-phenylpropionate/trans-cinnamate dioxygenase ferredoxin reductase component
MKQADIVIVGGGLAGASTAEEYRKAGGKGSLALLSQEIERPVHRPPLSKAYLRGDEEREKVFVHPADFYPENDIELQLGSRVVGVKPTARSLELAGRDSIEYGTLVLATGARPRRLNAPGGDLEGVWYLRSLKSSERLREAYAKARQAVIVGAGFIGMEVAATLTQKGVACTVVEMGPRMWPRLVPEDAAAALQRYCESKGITFQFGIGVAAIQGEGKVSSVKLENGAVLPADLVVAGVGAALNTELAQEAGLSVDAGVVVNEYFETSDPHVYAVGDIANFPDPIGGQMHLEHWDNALNQGRALGKILAGRREPFVHVAYFFSDIFDLSISMIGYPVDHDETKTSGDVNKPSFTTTYLKDGTVVAALLVNDDAEFDEWTRRVKDGVGK